MVQLSYPYLTTGKTIALTIESHNFTSLKPNENRKKWVGGRREGKKNGIESGKRGMCNLMPNTSVETRKEGENTRCICQDL